MNTNWMCPPAKARITLNGCWIYLLCTFFIALAASTASAQTSSTGALAVSVQDPSGAVIPGATVTVSNGVGVTRTNQTDASGAYVFTLLPPDNYTVTISAQGFRKLDISSVGIHVSETEALVEKLAVGQQTEQVEVTAEVAAVQTENSTMGNVVNATAITSLPLTTRNYLQIMNLSPGVGTDVNDATAVGRGLQAIYVNGTDATGSNFHMNGVTVSNYGAGGEGTGGTNGSAPLPSPDALQEFKVLTSNYDASYGRNAGGNVNVVTKSGTNEFHGTAFEYFRNTDLNANTFFLNRNGRPRGVLNQNQFGGVFGGPIKKNKLFFFISYQGTRQKNGISSSASVTDTLPEQLTDDRSLLTLENEFCSGNPNNAPGKPGYAFAHTQFGGQQITCPSGGAPGQGTVPVPVDTPGGLSSVALNLLNAKAPGGGYTIPTPQSLVASGSGLIGQASFSIPATFKEDQALANIDYNINSKNTLAFRYFFSFGQTLTPITGTAPALPDGGNTSLSGNELASAKLTTTITPNLVNEAQYGYYYIRASLVSNVYVTTPQLGITPAYPGTLVAPIMNVVGLFGSFGTAFDSEKIPNANYEWTDQLSWNHGRHSIRAGYEQATTEYFICGCGKLRGTLTYETFADLLLGESAAQNGSAYSNVYSANATIQLPSSPNDYYNHRGSLFFQDDFKANKRLTLNAGLRWDYLGTFADTNPVGTVIGNWGIDQTLPVPPAAGTYVGWTIGPGYKGPMLPGLVLRGTNLPTSGIAPLTNFAPRLGYAWQPFGNGKVVIRGGGGFFYNIVYGNQLTQAGESNPPIASAFSYTGTQNAIATNLVPFNPTVAPGTWVGFARTPTSAISQWGIAPNFMNPLTFGWNTTIQYAITPTLVLEAGYVGNRTEHGNMQSLFDIPQLATATNPVNCSFPSGCITTNTSANAAQRLPVLGFGVAGVQITTNGEDSSYNALQASLRKQFSHGLQGLASYTYGRCFNDANGAGGGSGQYNTSGDPGNAAQMRGPCSYIRPQRFVVNYTYQLPDYKAGNRIVAKALSGWAVAGVTTVQNGYPLTITDTRGGAVYGFPDIGIAQTAGASRAQMCPGMTYDNIPTSGSIESRLSSYLNSSAFCPIPVIGVVNGVGGATGYGNSGRGIVLGPPQFNFDASLVKRTVIGGIRESGSLEFRAEAFNIFNHPQFGSPAVNVAAPATFGVITSTIVGPRVLQLALRYAF